MAFLPFLHRVTEAKPLTEQEAEAAMHLIPHRTRRPRPPRRLPRRLPRRRPLRRRHHRLLPAPSAPTSPLSPSRSSPAVVPPRVPGGTWRRRHLDVSDISTVTAFVVAWRLASRSGNTATAASRASAVWRHRRSPRRPHRLRPRPGWPPRSNAPASAFPFAAVLHPGMKHVAPVRAELEMRTLCSTLLGPSPTPPPPPSS
jgi:hypothetical protein